jgi:hypothetical protein
MACLILVIGAGIYITRFSQAASSYDTAVLADNPVAYWAMTNTTGTEPDLTGHGHAGTYHGGTLAQGTLLNGNKAATFNGTNQYLSVPSSAALSIPTTHQLTWEAWIKPSTLQFPTGFKPVSGSMSWESTRPSPHPPVATRRTLDR